ncbi:MAG TPA: TonB-dependent receptor [Pyrinomonadaceae bacterium]|nr:TonB-dependent receptor [Pyrinomonadaceae bacterium]
MFKTVKLIFVSAIVLSLSAVVMAQSTTTGALGVTVTDPKGAVVPGATVTARNIETNKEVTATADDEGRARLINLQPGNYMVVVTAAGFGTFTQEKMVVEVGRVTNLEAPLALGSVAGSVDVLAEAPVINTSQQDFSSNVNETSINELPNNGRRWANFAIGTPGAVADGAFGLISFRGISGLLNNNTVDGADDNQAFFSEQRGRTRINYAVSQAAIREFQVNTSNYSAEYGRAAGGVINAVTKSGTNEFHGSAFIYYRDERFNARNPSTFVNNLPVKPEDNRKQFGGTIGGPIMKDKLFFFFSYDQQKRNFPGIAAPTNPGFFGTFNRDLLISRGLTGAQADAALDFARSLSGPVSRRGDQKIYLPKIDWRLNNKHTLTFTYNRLEWDSPAGVQTGVTVTRGIASFGDDLVNVDWGVLRLTSTITPTILNEARVQIGRDFERQIAPPPAPGEPTTALGGSSPSYSLGTSSLTAGKPTFLNRAAFPDERRQQYVDTLTMTHGNHVLKFGIDINRVKDLNANLFTESGSYAYSGGINDFLIDYVNFTSNGAIRALSGGNNGVCATSTRRAGQCYSGSFVQGFGTPAFTFRTTDYAFFAQDDWRVLPRLTLNLGLRYEYQKLPEPQLPNSLFDNDTRFTAKTSIFPADKNNFGPRVGFAWDINGDGKNSLRGGWGMYYGRITNSSLSNGIANTGAPGSQFTVSLSPASNDAAERAAAPIFPNVFTAAPSVGARPIPNIVVFAANMQNPLIHQTDVNYERLIATNTVASISFLGSWGHYLPQFANINLAPATTVTNYSVVGGPFNGQTITVPKFTTRFNTNFGAITEVQPAINTKYVAMVLQLNRRFTNNLQYQTNYTFAQSRDNGQNSSTFTDVNNLFDPYNPGLEGGYSNFDVRHKFVSSIVWHPDYVSEDNRVAHAIFSGFNIAPILSISSGTPYSAGVSGNVSGSPTGGGGITGSNGGNRFPLTGRNRFRQPTIWNLDMRVSRRFKLAESMSVELLAEGFNVFNRSQIVNVDTTAYNLSGTTLTFRPQFGSTAFTSNFFIRERQFQFAARFEF